ncbi:MAG TPA: (2Fe-2S)-binding protein [Prolixibacteraceae bacterium]|nr:(2Fe-2S)-binding protein [Prolixibacteraceae bacterium]
MGRKLVCLCNLVTEKEILSAIRDGAVSLHDVTELTGAGESCGRCRPIIENMLNEAAVNAEPNAQGRLF